MGTPLMIQNGAIDITRRLTYVIYWKPRSIGTNGHAAMIIDSSRIDPNDAATTLMLNNNNYVSWVGTGDGLISHTGQANNMYADRTAGWKGHKLNPNLNEYMPNRWVALNNLDIAAMDQKWSHIKNKPGSHWNLIDKNCATVVARVLKAGCVAPGAGVPWYKYTKAHQMVWWPSDLIDFARSLDGFVYRHS
jgi:hypothetical protein